MMENNLEVPKKYTELLYDSEVLFLGHNNKIKFLSQSDMCFPILIVALFMIVKLWNPPKYPSTHEQIKKCDIQIQWNTT